MKQLKHAKRNIILWIIAIIAALAVAVPFVAAAQELPRLQVVFDPNPLFSESNILPGDGVSGTVTVTNNSGEPQTIITEAINVVDPDNLSSNMQIAITDGDNNTYYSSGDGTFRDFLTSGEHTLTDTLGDSETAVYTYAVSFLPGTGDLYQETSLNFDLCVGFFSETNGMNCGDTVISGEGDTGGGSPGSNNPPIIGTSGGGGGPPLPHNLTISNETVESVDDVLGTAVITWDTNILSTSEVIYGLASGSYTLTTIPPDFGYPLFTTEDPTKVGHHSVTLTGLTPGQTYKYRVVSHASPPTVSYEHTFTVTESSALLPFPPPPSDGTSGNTGSTGTTGNTSGSGGGGGSTSLTVNGDHTTSTGSPQAGSGQATTSTSTPDHDRLLGLVAGLPNNEEGDTNNNGDGANGNTQGGGSDLAQAGSQFAAAAFFSGILGDRENGLLYALYLLILFIILTLMYRLIVGREKYAPERVRMFWYAGLILASIYLLFTGMTYAFVLLIVIAILIFISAFLSRERSYT